MVASVGVNSSIRREPRASRAVDARPGQSAAMNIIKLSIAVLALGATACATSGDPMGYASQYRDALRNSAAEPPDATIAAQRFVEVYADLRAPDLAQKLASFYAPELWFNDTLATITDRDDLVRYMVETGDKVEAMEVQILDAFARGPDVFIRWGMQLEFKAGWRTARTDTVGITQLRFDESGRVILHQDFWDNAEGIFREVPLVRRAVALETFE